MSELTGLYAIWYREIKVFFREKSRIISSVVSPLMWLVIFGTGLGSAVAIQGANYQTFIFPGILVMTVLFSSLFFGLYIIFDKRVDFLKEVMVAPLNRTTIFLGKVLGGSTDGMIQVVIILVLGPIFGIHYTVLSVIASIVLLLLLTIGITSIGLAIGSFMESPEGFGLISSFVIFPLFFLSGALFPIDKLPVWLLFFVRLNPITYGVDALRGLMLGLGTINPVIDFAIVLAFSIVMLLVGSWAFKRLKL